jgi:hypothetical protein
MQVNSLRELAAAYARGDIGREDYRRSRSDLIAAVLRGEIQLRVNDHPPVGPLSESELQDITTPRGRAKPAAPEVPPPEARPAAAPAASSGRRALPAWLIPAAVGAVVIIGAAVIFLGGDEAPVAPPQAAAPVEEAALAPATEPAAVLPDAAEPAVETPAADGTTGAAGRALISAFLEDRDWSPARREALLAEWANLSAEEREAVRNSVEQGQLASAIYKKLLEERALSGLGDREAAQARERELARFAEQMGIDDPRLKAPENIGGDANSGVPALDGKKPLNG